MKTLTCSVNIEILTPKPHAYHIVANPQEREIVRNRLSLLSLEKLEAQLTLQRKNKIHLTGMIYANVTQQCVRTLVPLPQHLEIKVDEFFSPSSLEGEEAIDLNLEELTEPLEGSIMDLGEIVTQLLSLNLDPYPVIPSTTPFNYQEDKGPSSPFEVLKKKE